MDINAVLTIIVTGAIGLVFWALKTFYSDWRKKKQDAEKEYKRQIGKWLGPGGVAPKDVNEALSIAKSEGKDVRNSVPKGINILLILLGVTALGVIFQRGIQQYSQAQNTQTPISLITSTNIPSTNTKTITPSITSSPKPSCQAISPNINTASFGGSVWINFPAHCATDIKPGEPVSASGDYSNLPPNTIIWVFVCPPNGPFYPQSPNACAGPPSPYPSQGGGGWSVPVYFGNLGDSSKLFDLVVMVTDQAGGNYIGQRLYEDCSNGYYDGISAGELAGLNITTKATINIKTR
jgi:hypothetical protein